jgi:hypothetical protein
MAIRAQRKPVALLPGVKSAAGRSNGGRPQEPHRARGGERAISTGTASHREVKETQSVFQKRKLFLSSFNLQTGEPPHKIAIETHGMDKHKKGGRVWGPWCCLRWSQPR